MTARPGGRQFARTILQVVVAWGAIVYHVSESAATPYSLVNIADTMSAGPTGTLTSLGMPAISGDRVAFFAGYSGGQVASGVFVGSGGGLTTIVKQGDLAPGSVSLFSDFGFDVSISGGEVAFWGNTASLQRGYYVGDGGPVTTIVKQGDAAPTGAFTDLASALTPSIDGGAVAFSARTGSFVTGLYSKAGGVTTTIVKQGDAVPGGGTFTLALSEPSLSGDEVAFRGSWGPGSQSGIFIGDGNALTTIVKTGDAAPSGTFTSLAGTPALDDGVAAFRGVYGSGQGVFLGSGGTLTTVVKSGDAAPSGIFESFAQTAISGDVVAFTGVYDGGKIAAFAVSGGIVEPVLKPGDILFGSTVQQARVGRFGLDPDGSGRLAISYLLANGISGVAMATPVPEPTTIALAGLLIPCGAMLGRGRSIMRGRS